MAKIIFKQLEEAVYSARNRLQSQPFVDEEAKRLEESRYAALMEIVKYTRSLDFLSHASGKEKLRFFFKCRYNYKLTAEHFGCPLNNIESAVSYAGKCLERRIGKDTIRMIVQAQSQEALDAALLQFRVGVNPGGDQRLFLGDLSQWFPEPANMGFRVLDEFRMELRLLHFFSTSFFKECLAVVDHKRLAHLLYIMQSTDNAHVMERQVLYRMLQGNYQSFEEAWDAWTSLQEKNLFASEEEEFAVPQ
ncbi:hypothetical protein SD70_19310 [Gordoniibacillus kamchatkensis]|uniref:Uncharacterized protein n=1 Tax=Gordoniibacillus kamchatkensis TaxID=1590651 RepID=A0ABR5AES5_9BACL|nr:hypothetical protein [Paenibacillus sp. VKM B-2647]KIL39554.1 hypothetical protein SD70_19310 [Paenibacillus sp. VKM B-2647]